MRAESKKASDRENFYATPAKSLACPRPVKAGLRFSVLIRIPLITYQTTGKGKFVDALALPTYVAGISEAKGAVSMKGENTVRDTYREPKESGQHNLCCMV